MKNCFIFNSNENTNQIKLPGTSFGLILVCTITESVCDSSHLVRICMVDCTIVSASLCMKLIEPLSKRKETEQN